MIEIIPIAKFLIGKGMSSALSSQKVDLKSNELTYHQNLLIKIKNMVVLIKQLHNYTNIEHLYHEKNKNRSSDSFKPGFSTLNPLNNCMFITFAQ